MPWLTPSRSCSNANQALFRPAGTQNTILMAPIAPLSFVNNTTNSIGVPNSTIPDYGKSLDEVPDFRTTKHFSVLNTDEN